MSENEIGSHCQGEYFVLIASKESGGAGVGICTLIEGKEWSMVHYCQPDPTESGVILCPAVNVPHEFYDPLASDPSDSSQRMGERHEQVMAEHQRRGDVVVATGEEAVELFLKFTWLDS